MASDSAKLLDEVKPLLPDGLWEALRARLLTTELRVQLLEEKLRLRRIEQYGPGSERLSSAQLELLEFEPGVSAREVEAEGQREPLPAKPAGPKRGARAGQERASLPEHLERRVRTIACAPGNAVCSGCGGATAVIGYDESERLDVEPVKYFVQVTRREKRACGHCPDRGVAMGPVPAAIIEKGLASDRVVIGTVVAKYLDHLPLYRQSAMLARDAGVEIGRATLNGWVLRTGELLQPLALAMAQRIRAGTYIQADETPIGVQMHDGRGKNHQAYLWQYGQPGGEVIFDFRMGRGREGPRRFLAGYAGVLQTDGYAAYDGLGAPGMVHAACWAHARRKFHDAAKVSPDDRAAIGLVARINALFALDAEARLQGLDPAARHALRQSQAPALLELIRRDIEAARAAALPASLLGKAARYTLALWPKLVCFLQHPELELSNNIAENSMRPIALGRKNWIHLGSEQAAPRVAAILSVVESCRRLGISLRDYLAAVLPGLADQPVAKLSQLTPSAWADVQPQ